MLKLAKYLKDYKYRVILAPLLKLLEAILELITPLVMANIIDVGIANRDVNYILFSGGIMILLALIGWVCAMICQYHASVTSQGFGTKLRNVVFEHINSLSKMELDKFGSATLTNRMTWDINQLQQTIAMLIRLVTRAPFLVIGATVMAIRVNLKLSVIFIAASILIALTLYIVMNKSVPFFKSIQKKLDRISLISEENLLGSRIIRAFCKQENEKNKFENAASDLSKEMIAVGRLSAILNPATYVIANLAIAGIIWFGGYEVNNNRLATGEVIALVNYMTQILLAMIVVANLIVLFTKGSSSAMRINEILETKPTIMEAEETVKEKETQTVIEFQSVCFSYGGKKNVLNNINFTLNKGETLGIIGATGSGKSTIVNLIMHFYDAEKGTILFNGTDIKKYPFKQLNSQIGLVPQQTALFSGSVRENIKKGNPNASDDDIIKALKTAQAWEFVSGMRAGLDTPISQGGKNLSGGQKQRLTIARALIKKPKLLILDDSSSALDFSTDAKLRQAIRQSTYDITVIIISQRIPTVSSADKIICLDDGEIVGIGTHEQLTKSCSEYREICKSQEEL